jgi:type IV pilus assembly protein PilX
MNAKQQNGSALIITILLLVGISVIGFAAINSSMLEERIAGNERDRTTAFNAAESALRNAENYLNEKGKEGKTMPVFGLAQTKALMDMNQHSTFSQAVPSTRFTANAKFDVTSEELWAAPEAIAWMIANGTEYGSDPDALAAPIPELKTRQPRYFIEEMSVALGTPKPRNYRITAVGWGDAESVVVLQSYYTPLQKNGI